MRAPIAPSPTKPTRRHAAGRLQVDAVLRQHVLGDAERIHGRGHAAVDRRLQEHLLDLGRGDAVVERAAEVQPQLMRADPAR